MNKTLKIGNNVYYFSHNKQINKISKTIIYPKTTKYDFIYISLLLDTLTYRIKKYDKYKFKLEKAINYDVVYTTNFKEIDNNILVNLEVSFLNMEYISAEESLELVSFIENIFSDMFIERKDLELTVNNNLNYLEKLKDKSTQMGKILISEYIYKSDKLYLTYEESIESLKRKDIIDQLMELLEKLQESENYYYFIEGSDITKNNLIDDIEINNKQEIDIKEKVSKIIDSSNEEIDLIKTDNQATLIMVYQYENLKVEEEYILKLLNMILGGSSFSKLFVNIREKENICYSISSQDKLDFGLEIIAEVDQDNISLAKKRIKEQVLDIQKGNIEFEFKNAKNKYVADLKAGSNKGYLQKITLDKNLIRKTKFYDLDKLIEYIETIQEEDIIELSKKMNYTKSLVIS